MTGFCYFKLLYLLCMKGTKHDSAVPSPSPMLIKLSFSLLRNQIHFLQNRKCCYYCSYCGIMVVLVSYIVNCFASTCHRHVVYDEIRSSFGIRCIDVIFVCLFAKSNPFYRLCAWLHQWHPLIKPIYEIEE